MFRHFIKRLAVAALAGSLAAAMLPAAFTSASTPAGWYLTATPRLSQVAPGSVQVYDIVIGNKGPSSIAKLYLSDSIVGAVPVYKTSAFPCALNVELNCSFGAFKPSREVKFALGFRVSNNTNDGHFAITFRITTTGVVYSNSTSHGDDLPAPTSSTVNSSPNFAGGFVIDGGPVQTGQTKVIPPENNIAVTISEGGSGVACGTGIGTQADVNINDGASYTITPNHPLMVITISTSGIPNSKKLTDFKVCHKYDNSTTAQLPRCADSTDSTAIACFWPHWGPTKPGGPGDYDADDFYSVIFDVYDVSNGGLRGGF